MKTCNLPITLTIQAPASCGSVFASPNWYTQFAPAPSPPQQDGTGSGLGVNFSASASAQAGFSIQTTEGFGGGVTPNLPYTPGAALSCHVSVNCTQSGIVNSALQLTATLVDTSTVVLVSQIPLAAGNSSFPFTIPANCVSLSFVLILAAGNGLVAGSISVTGAFGV